MQNNEDQTTDYPSIWGPPRASLPPGPASRRPRGDGPAVVVFDDKTVAANSHTPLPQAPSQPLLPSSAQLSAPVRSSPQPSTQQLAPSQPPFQHPRQQPAPSQVSPQPPTQTHAPFQAPIQPVLRPLSIHPEDHAKSELSPLHSPIASSEYDDQLGPLPGASRDQNTPFPEQTTNQAQRTKRIAYGTRTPLVTERSYVALFFVVAYLASLVYYLYVRIRYTLDTTNHKGYHIYILVVECLGITAVLPYALLQVSSTRPSGSPGLPPDDGISIGDKCFNINVLVPCYSESLECITATVTAAMDAPIPPGCTKKVWLCDDGNKADKKAFMAKFGARGGYVTGRTRKNPEMNGKSANVNNVLKNYIFKQYAGREDDIPWNEVIVVFDADMCAKRDFFLKVLEVLLDDKAALCLTPQAFSNINPNSDIFNNINQQFWEYVLPGCDAWGYIACTGTNFCIRAQALARCGWFPEYTITEDYALSMELKKKGFNGRYLCEYLAVGEAPDEARNLFRQRSRWTKGHMQIFFSSRCPLLPCNGLSLTMKWLYTNGTWAYFCNILTTPTFILVPFISLMFGVHPVVFSRTFALAALAYLGTNFLIMNYFRKPDHLMGLWLANLSNYILCFTYFKAVVNTLLVKVHIKKASGFKVTEKAGGSVEPSQQNMLTRIASLGRTVTNRAATAMMAIGKPQPYLPVVDDKATRKKEEQKMKEAMVKIDKIVLLLAFQICMATIVLGLHYVWLTGTAKAHQVLPMLWAAYNAVPPLIFFVYLFAVNPKEDRALELMCFWMRYISTACALGAMICLWFSNTSSGDAFHNGTFAG